MKKYPSQEKLKELFHYFNGQLHWKKTRNGKQVIGNPAGGGHQIKDYVTIKGVSYHMKTIMWIYHNGDIPEGHHVARKSNCWSNNSIQNLKLRDKIGLKKYIAYQISKRYKVYP